MLAFISFQCRRSLDFPALVPPMGERQRFVTENLSFSQHCGAANTPLCISSRSTKKVSSQVRSRFTAL